ncbi:ATP-dependent DNA helicase [Corynebacterium massiliense]|uniref:PD-(D/E)XK nuclease family protein n=1 Tax=Corynebacterium massiliense TaxID=441501 RepID=UPI002354711C|nr:ATP-dependent DNA helicase [Corynebacterium massiliense]
MCASQAQHHGQAPAQAQTQPDRSIFDAVPTPRVRLVERPAPDPEREWDFPLPSTGRWKVTGAAGSGVSSVVVDTVVRKLRDGADPSGVLVVTASKEAGARVRREISQRLDDYAAKSSMVHSVHSLAFALLRSDERAAETDLRLITGAEQDSVIRELLVGHAESGAGSWPAEVRPALEYVGFARQLRDFLLRAIERGYGPDDLRKAGEKFRRPMWSAAGDFLREYEQTLELAGVHSYSAPELVFQVLLRPQLTAEHAWHTIVVDDAQLLDPTSGRLVERLMDSAELAVVAGDPDQAVFGFRGASTQFLNGFQADQSLHLTTARRTGEPARVVCTPTTAAERDVVADTARRRHLEDGVEWRDIAVIVRSTGDIGQMSRALLAAGVPVHINPTDVVLAEQRLVAALLLGLRALEAKLSNGELEDLITGPVGGADPVTLRRLIRGLRRAVPSVRGIDTLRLFVEGEADEALREAVAGVLTDSEARVLDRVTAVLAAGRQELAAGASVEQVLWAVWQATGLDTRLQSAALRGGATGSQADRDLDAMMALFDAAGDFTERRPNGTLATFIAHIEEQELPTGVRDRRAAMPQAVPVLTAHGAVGNEWDTVVVAGAQEGDWPSFGETGSLFDQAELVDLIDHDIDPDDPVSHLADRLAEERRLFHVATTRHRSRLTVVAVDAPDADEVQEPSRFIRELVAAPGASLEESGVVSAGADTVSPDSVAANTAPEGDLPPVIDPLQVSVLSVPGFVSRLRRVLCDEDETPDARQQAARQLARLAQAGVPGAHPDQWWATRGTAAGNAPQYDPAVDGREPTLSPSKIEDFLRCPLQATLKRFVEDDQPTLALAKGNLAHAFMEALGRVQLARAAGDPAADNFDVSAAKHLVVEAFAACITEPAWRREQEMADFTSLLDTIAIWHAANTEELVGTEVKARVRITADTGEATVYGSIDRLQRVPDGGLRVVDLKTGKYPPSSKEVQDHPQLSAYQLVLAGGQLTRGADGTWRVETDREGNGEKIEGAQLYYPLTYDKKEKTCDQAALEPEALARFSSLLPPLVGEMTGATVTARENDKCPDCPVRHLCPIQPEGRLTYHHG